MNIQNMLDNLSPLESAQYQNTLLLERAAQLIADPESLFYGATDPQQVADWLAAAIRSL